MGELRILSTLLVALAAPITSLSAAKIEVETLSSGQAVVIIRGELTLEDGEKFARLASNVDPTIIIFNSPGGNLFAGLRIGEIARARKITTLVPDNALCASACAIAWLGGSRRFLGPKAHLGFHAAYISVGSTNSVSGSANAIVGAYLDRLGLSTAAIFALTDAGPEEIQWIDVGAANALGIETEMFRLDSKPATLRPSGTVPTAPQARALAVANDYFSAASSDTKSAYGFLATRYGPSIAYYGKATPRSAVLSEKSAFLRRWPERLYVPLERSFKVTCATNGKTCWVTGNVQFECRSYTRGAYSAGLATFAIEIDFKGYVPMIIGESGTVTKRR